MRTFVTNKRAAKWLGCGVVVLTICACSSDKTPAPQASAVTRPLDRRVDFTPGDRKGGNTAAANLKTSLDGTQPTTSGRAPINGLSMYYQIHGTGGMPLVLIHGGGSTIETTFGRILPSLADYGRVIAVELQAHGRTSDRASPETFEQDGDDVVALLAYLKVDKANFLGFSDGGCTAMQIAISHPNVVNKVVLISANYKRDGMIPGFFEGLQNAKLADMPAPLKAAYLNVAPDKNHLQAMFEKDVQRRLAFKDRTDDDLRSIKAAVLLMGSDHDVVTPEHDVAMLRLIPNARLVILPGAHGSFIEAAEAGAPKNGNKFPEITVALVQEFLTGE